MGARPKRRVAMDDTLQMNVRPKASEDVHQWTEKIRTLQMTTWFEKGHVKVTDVTLEEVGVSSKTKATENTDGSYGARRRISTYKRRSGSCRR